jgi:hypothetical protein
MLTQFPDHYVLDKDIAEWADRPIEQIRYKITFLAKWKRLFHAFVRVNTGNGSECSYRLHPLDALILIQHFNKGTPTVAMAQLKPLLDATYATYATYAQTPTPVEVDSAVTTAPTDPVLHKLVMEPIRVEPHRADPLTSTAFRDREFERMKERLDELEARHLSDYADSVFMEKDFSVEYPENVCHSFLQVGQVRVMWHHTRIFVRFPRESRHSLMRTQREWHPETLEENHDFQGLIGMNIRTSLPVCFFDSMKHPRSIVVGFAVHADMPDEDYEEQAVSIARTIQEPK